MKLSVVIPTYNRKRSLLVTLQGLAGQAYPSQDFEVVVVSDGSSDGTDELVAEFSEAAPCSIRYFTQENHGPSAARNRGVREARHEVIVFLDDDVEPVADFLERHASHHRSDDQIAILGPMSPDPARAISEPVWIAWEHAKLQTIYDFFLPRGPFTGKDAGPMHFYTGNASVRRQWLLDVGGFDESYTRQEDVELAMRLSKQCGIRFRFDFLADGLHRPERSLKSWLRIPRSYGRFDAQRVHAGQVAAETLQANIKKRSSITRFLASCCIALPLIQPALVGMLMLLSVLLFNMKLRRLPLALLSVLYNTNYIFEFRRASAALHH